MKPKNNISFRNKDYCIDCGRNATKRCRCCGAALCGICFENDGMCEVCNRDADHEYVDEQYRNTTIQAY